MYATQSPWKDDVEFQKLLAWLVGPFQAAQQAVPLFNELKTLEPLPADDPGTPEDEAVQAAARKAELNDQIDRLAADFQAACQKAATEYVKWITMRTSPNGSYKTVSGLNLDVTRTYVIDVNSYLPESELFKIGYWHVYGRKP